MKKQIAIAMGLAVLSTPALATKARLEALGEDSFGSQFIEDNRNIFLNPATVNFHKDIVTYEWGSSDTTASTNAGGANDDQDTAANPKAEGGFLKASGNMVYGLHLGSESNTSNTLRTAAMGANAVHEDNNIDLFVGGDAGIQWGASVTYSDTKDETDETEQSATRIRLGGVSGNISAFAQINVDNKAEDSANNVSFDGNSGYQLGATYEMNDMYYMVQYRAFSGDDEGGNELSATRTWVGAAKQYKLNDRANVWLSAFYKMEKDENDFVQSGAPGETKRNYLPIALAAEVDVKEWLTLRGSVGQNLIGTQEEDNGDEVTLTNHFVNAGASLVFGDFQIDGLVGTSDQASTSVGGASTDGGNGTLRTDALLSRVSMLYRF